ncbi:MAG: hypothetical protein J2P23_01435 [Microlunatus sp.]|nr:hypothetical protein [Microlunatus sp.]
MTRAEPIIDVGVGRAGTNRGSHRRLRPGASATAGEPPQLQARDVPAVWLTMVYASLYALAHSRLFVILFGLLSALVTVRAVLVSGWHGVPGALEFPGVVLAVVAILTVVMPPMVLLIHTIGPDRRVWTLPGGRAVVTARRTRVGWRADNASARPIGGGTADELFAAICAFADRTGAVIHAQPGNLRLAKHYVRHYGGTMHRTALGGLRVERQPMPPAGPRS